MDLNCSPIGRRHLLSDSRKMCDNFCTLPTIRCDWSLLPLFLLSTSIVDCILKRHTMPPISLPHNVQHHCHGCIITVPCPPWKHLSAAIRWTTCATKVFTLYVADSGGSYSTHVPKSTTEYNNAMVWLHFPFERPFRDQFNWHIPHSIAGKYMCGQKEEAGTSKWLAEISIHSLKLNNTFSLQRCSFTFKY